MLLDDVADAAAALRDYLDEVEPEITRRRERLLRAMRRAVDEGIPQARVARAAGLSRERVRQLLREQK